MDSIIFEGIKYKLVPLNKFGIERKDSKILFFTKCDKSTFEKFVKENPMEYFIDNTIYDEMYIKKFKFFEYIIYYKLGYLILDTPIKLRQLREIGDKYYAIDETICNIFNEITNEKMEYLTEKDSLPFNKIINQKCKNGIKCINEIKCINGIKCKKEGCNVLVKEDEYCGKHLILKSLKKWLYKRYLNEYEWKEKIEIFLY